MCGIAGVFNRDQRPVDADVLVRMTRSIVHRGPDEEGYFLNRQDAGDCYPGVPMRGLARRDGDGHVGFGHRRLSIIDLKTGQQPLSNEDGTVWITFNGEIYNHASLRPGLEAKGHRFRSRTDTEAIIHQYEVDGPDCLNALDGMFALGIWDAARDRLMLARDRLGKKPLYYTLSPDGRRLRFASEVKALSAAGHEDGLETSALPMFLSFGCVPAPATLHSTASSSSAPSTSNAPPAAASPP